MFPTYQERLVHPYDSDTSYPVLDVAAAVFRQLRSPLTTKEMLDVLSAGYGHLEGDPLLKTSRLRLAKSDVEAWERAKKKNDKRVLKEFLKAHPKLVFFAVEFGDRDGEFHGAIEHGDAFISVPHLVVGHH
jgi:hypothetical protein